MFPLAIYIPYSVMSYYSLYFMTMAILGMKPLVLTVSSLCGLFTVFGTMLLFRIADEFKDAATDKLLFPHRPLARGVVKFSDIRILGIIIFIIMLTLNAFFISLWIPFAAILLYGLLTFKWFFMEKHIRNSLLLAVITHQPLTLIVNIYIVFTVFLVTGHTVFSFPVICALFIFFLPVLAWETSRKIRPLGEETDYVTYSKLFGPVKAALIPLISMLLAFILILFIAYKLNFLPVFFILLISLALIYMFFYLRFMFNPVKKNLMLKSVSEYTSILMFIIILAALVIDKGFRLAW